MTPPPAISSAILICLQRHQMADNDKDDDDNGDDDVKDIRDNEDAEPDCNGLHANNHYKNEICDKDDDK